MIYNVAQLLKAVSGTSQRVELDNDDELILSDGEPRLAGVVEGSVRLHRTNQGIFADGEAIVPVELECTRCLKHFSESRSVALHELYYPTIDINTGLPAPAPDDELAFPIDHNHILDLREAIRQNLLAALPIQTLCTPECKGLCQYCGHDLNDGPCACKPETADDRLAVLRQLLEANGD